MAAFFTRIRTTTESLLRWFSAFWQWAQEPHLAWFTILVIAAAIISVGWMRSEPGFRLTGLALQLLGTATVAWNIRETRVQFGRPGTFELAVQWWQRRPRFRTSVTVAVGAANFAIASGKARAEVWSDIDPNAPIEVRLDAAEKNLNRVRQQLHEFRQETEREIRQSVDALNHERQIRENDDEGIRETMEASQIGGLNISAAGVVLLVVGATMSTASVELAKLLLP